MSIKILSLVNCYRNEKEVIKYCLMVYSLHDGDKISVVVTVNALSKGEDSECFRKKLMEISPLIRVYFPQENLGYLNGMFYGYKKYCAEYQEEQLSIRWVMMSNTDIVIKSGDFVSKLCKSDYSDSIVCIAPKIHRLNPEGYEKHYKVRYGKNKLVLLYVINKVSILSAIYGLLSLKKKTSDSAPDNESKEIYEAHGSCFIIKVEFMKVLLERKWPCLMYNEEGFVSNIIYHSNKKEYYDSELIIDHYGSTTTSLLPSKDKKRMLTESYRYLMKTYYHI